MKCFIHSMVPQVEQGYAIPTPAFRLLLGVWVLIAAATATAAQDAPAGAGALANRVLELDGSGAHVELPVATFDGLRKATVEAWVRYDSWEYFTQWFAYGTSQQWRAMGANHWSVNPVFQFFIYPSGKPEDLHVVAIAKSHELGQWHHWAIVTGNGGMRLYLDGKLMGSHPYTGSFADVGPGTEVLLGRSTWSNNADFSGGLDEVRLWSVARSAEEIRSGMRRTLRGDERGLLGLWNFDAGDARDGSAGGDDGTLREGARCVVAPYPGLEERLLPALLSGAVRDESGEPMHGAQVRLQGGNHVVDASSNAVGEYAVAVFDTGAFTVQVHYGGELLVRREVEVAPGAHVVMDLEPPPAHLVASWPGEGDARDGIGTLHGELSGEVSFAPGVVGQAFQFDRDGEGVVRVPNAAALNPKGSFSLVAWVFPESGQELNVMSMWGDYAGWAHQRAYDVSLQPGRRVSFNFSDTVRQEDGAYHLFQTRPNVVTLHAWTHVVAVWDAESGERRIYTNGRLAARRAYAPASMARSRADLGIGLHLHSPGVRSKGFEGRIDEVGFYGVALSDEKIARLYCTQAVARWAGEENANDATRSGHDGVPVGGVSFAPGVIGQAFAFDGRDAYVEFDPRIGNYGVEDFSVELWLRAEPESGSSRVILSKGYAGTDALYMSLYDGGHIAVTLASRQDSLHLVGGAQVAPGSWHHVVLVREAGQVRLFFDGELDGSVTTRGQIELQTPGPLLLGGAPQAQSFHGRIDEVALHRLPLSAEEIRATSTRVEADWRWNIWRERLQTWGSVAVGLLLLVTGTRYASHRRTRRRQRQQLAEAERAREAADEANQAKSAFLANMSHEIRTPMNSILGHAQMLRDEPLTDEEQHHGANAICDSGNILLRLIDDILDLSKVEAGRMDLHLVEFDLGHLIGGLQTLFEVRSRQKGLKLRIERDLDMGVVRGDETKLRQVLVNLLGNAVKFTDEGEVVLRVVNCGQEFAFEVSDSGPGIASELRDAAFEPFQQGASGLARGGTGLGLAIAQRHVTLMGGRLELVSPPGGGACFSFSVRLETVDTVPEPAAAANAAEVASFEGLALPPELRGRLREAAQMHNVTEVKRCLEELTGLGARQAQLAEALAPAVQRFDLAPVIEALEATVDA